MSGAAAGLRLQSPSPGSRRRLNTEGQAEEGGVQSSKVEEADKVRKVNVEVKNKRAQAEAAVKKLREVAAKAKLQAEEAERAARQMMKEDDEG